MRVPDLDHEDNVAFEEYERERPVAVPIDATAEMVKVQGAAGPSSVDAVLLKNILTMYEKASAELESSLSSNLSPSRIWFSRKED